MKLIYLSCETKAEDFAIATVESKNQNKYGVMLNFREKLELVTSEQIARYHVFASADKKDKMFLCVKSPQLQTAL